VLKNLLVDEVSTMGKRKNRPSETLKVVSLFSGCGGMDLGFLGGFEFAGKKYEELANDVVWANDISPAACNTYSLNFDHKIQCGDVWDYLETLPESADVVIGGFPCQDVSINGKLLAENGARSTLYMAMVEAVRRVQPQIFVAENVKGLLMAHSEKIYAALIEAFTDLGYRVSTSLYLAADFGVPQMRERAFIVGTKSGGPFNHPTALLRQRVSAEDVLCDLENEPEDRTISHIWSKAAASPDQGSRRLKADVPATTIRAECHGNIQFHYRLDRRISMREAARLQSFPDEFQFASGLRETERQIGNAVPPVLAWHIANAVQEHLE